MIGEASQPSTDLPTSGDDNYGWERLASALRLGAHLLDSDPGELENQLVGRLDPLPELSNLPDDRQPRFRLLSQTLTAPGGPLVLWWRKTCSKTGKTYMAQWP